MAYPIDPTSATFAPFVGSFQSENPVADTQDLYVSSQGIAVRIWKDKAGVRFWDELLVPFSPVATYTDETAPLGGVGAQYPTFTAANGGSVTVAVAPSSVLEDGEPNLVFTFTRNSASRGSLTVNYTVTGTATNGVDYVTVGSFPQVTFEGNALTATVTIDPITDVLVEGNETVILTITPSGAYTVGSPAAATGTITNDDT